MGPRRYHEGCLLHALSLIDLVVFAEDTQMLGGTLLAPSWLAPEAASWKLLDDHDPLTFLGASARDDEDEDEDEDDDLDDDEDDDFDDDLDDDDFEDDDLDDEFDDEFDDD